MDKFNLTIKSCKDKMPLVSVEPTNFGKKYIMNLVINMNNEELEEALEDLETYERRIR